MAKRLLVFTFECACGATQQAAQGTELALLKICAGCQEKRVKAGKEAQRKAGVIGG